jgi:hypothetical protein
MRAGGVSAQFGRLGPPASLSSAVSCHFERMDIFIRYPGLALVPAVLFLAAYVQHRLRIGRGFRFSRVVVSGAGIVWLLYTIYELSVQRELPPESVPIRIDLLVVYPALLAATAAGVVAYAAGFRRALRPPNRVVPLAAPASEEPTTPATPDERLAHLVKKV